jgi:hypothetical protein
LDFAIGTGQEHGGYVPRGCKVEDGRIDARYNLVELSTSSYPARTKRNIEESDGTVIFSKRAAEMLGCSVSHRFADCSSGGQNGDRIGFEAGAWSLTGF